MASKPFKHPHKICYISIAFMLSHCEQLATNEKFNTS
jgi:hypothetical protein